VNRTRLILVSIPRSLRGRLGEPSRPACWAAAARGFVQQHEQCSAPSFLPTNQRQATRALVAFLRHSSRGPRKRLAGGQGLERCFLAYHHCPPGETASRAAHSKTPWWPDQTLPPRGPQSVPASSTNATCPNWPARGDFLYQITSKTQNFSGRGRSEAGNCLLCAWAPPRPACSWQGEPPPVARRGSSEPEGSGCGHVHNLHAQPETRYGRR